MAVNKLDRCAEIAGLTEWVFGCPTIKLSRAVLWHRLE